MYSTVPTKFSVPQPAAELIPRPLVLHLYGQSLRRQLTLVTAPAGYGKTTSTAEWVCSLTSQVGAPPVEPRPEIKTAWYALDAEDDDFGVFFTRFVRALETTMPGALPMMATGLAIQGVTPLQYANSLAEACLNLPCEAVLVLDDYHVITKPEIHAVLAHLIQHASSRLHLVVTARHDPPLPISRLRARQQLVEVRADDLRLTDTEAAAFLQLRLLHAPSPELLSILQVRTEGWVAGLQLAAASLNQERQDEFLAHFRHSDSTYVMDFLIDEVLEHTPADIRIFLLKTALVERFTVNLAAVMTQLDTVECGQLLARVHHANLFVVPSGGDPTWYRYHHQFRSMLLNRARLMVVPEEIAAIQRAAALWLVSHGWIDEAITGYVAEGEWDRAAELIETERHTLQNGQRWYLLWRRLARLPDNVVAQRPGLLLARAWILQVDGRYAAMSAVVEQAAALLASDKPGADVVPSQVLWGEICALRGAWFFTEVPIEGRLALLQEALGLLSPAQQYGWARGFAFISLVHTLLGRGEREVAHRQIVQEIEAAATDSGFYLVRLYHALGTLEYLDGSLSELYQVGLRYLQLAMRHTLPMPAAWARFAMGWSHFQRAESSLAFDVLRPIFDRPQEVHLQNLTMALTALVAAAAEIGRSDEAAQVLAEVRRIALERENSTALGETLALAAYAALLNGDRQTALVWAAEFARQQQSTSGQANSQYTVSAVLYIFAKVMLAAGSKEQINLAIAPLHAAFATFQRCGYQHELVQAAVLLACCYWRTNQPAKASDWMQQAVESGAPRGFRRVFFEQGADAAAVLYAMAQRGICADAASQLLEGYGKWRASGQPAAPALRPATEGGIAALSSREEEVLLLMAQRLSNKEIARRLDVSVFTVRNHTSHIYEKLNVASRKQAIALAVNLHLLPPPSTHS